MNNITNATQQNLTPATLRGGAVSDLPLQKELAPVLGEKPLNVSASSTDFEKLLAKTELERDERRQATCAQRFALALQTLMGQHQNLTAAQSAALDNVTKASRAYELAALEQKCAQIAYNEALTPYNDAKNAYNGAVNELTIMTQQLEALIEAQTKTPEEREKEQKAKAQRAVDQAEEVVEEEEVDLEKEIEALKGQIEQQKSVVDKAKDDFDKATEALDKAKTRLDAAEGVLATAGTVLAGAMSKAMAALDGSQAKAIAGAVRQLAAEIVAAATERDDGGETVEKANAIIVAMEEYIEAVEEMQLEKLEEMTAKISTDLQFLLRCERTLQPGELGEYNEIV